MIFHENLTFRCGNAHTHSVMNNVFISKVGTFLHFSRNFLCRSHVFYVTRKINYQPVSRPLSPPFKERRKKSIKGFFYISITTLTSLGMLLKGRSLDGWKE